MRRIIDGLPEGLDLSALRSGKAGAWSRDETVFGPDGRSFATAFDIVEASMGNEMGRLLWGSWAEVRPQILGHLQTPLYCWSRPFCHWLAPGLFVVKIATPEGRLPLLAIDIARGFQRLGRDTPASRPAEITAGDLSAEFREQP